MKRRRELPAPGTVEVRAGDSVMPDQVIARASVASGTFVVHATRTLGIEPGELLSACSVREGAAVEEGAVLARHSGLLGLLSTRVQSPVKGIVEYVSPLTGHIGIKLPPREIELRAFLKGTVSEVIPERGAVIDSRCTVLNGIFGVGGERSGTLRKINVKKTDMVRATSLPDDIKGAVLFGGAGVNYGALKTAAEKGAVCIITGAVDDNTLQQYLGYELGIAVTGNEKVPLTLIVTEGFGNIPMNERALSLLRKNIGMTASVNGMTQVRAGAVRPEIFIFSGEEAASADSEGRLSAGDQVRVIRHPYFGKTGRIETLPESPQRLETGADARVFGIRLDEEGLLVTVPRANVERL